MKGDKGSTNEPYNKLNNAYTGNSLSNGKTSSPGNPKWVFETGGDVKSSPTVVDGTVYVGSHDNKLYAVDSVEGGKKWSFKTGGEILSSPMVSDGTVYIGSGDNNLYAVDTESGEKRWQFQADDEVNSSPLVLGGTIYVGSSDGNLYAISEESGEEQWRFETHRSVISSPVVSNGNVYFGSENLYAVDIQDGSEQWRLSIPGYVYSSPTVVDGTVYGGCNSGVYSVNAQSGEEQWTFEIDHVVNSSATYFDGTVYIGSYVGNLYAIDAESGAEQWRFETGVEVFSSPSVANDTVYFGESSAGKLYAVDAMNGEEQWQFEAKYFFESSPTVVDGIVYIGCNNGNLYAVETEHSEDSSGSRVRLSALGHHSSGNKRRGQTATPTPVNTKSATGTPSQTSSSTETSSRTPVRTPTATHTELRRRLQKGTQVNSGIINGKRYRVLQNIPQENTDRYAFTTKRYRLLGPDQALDVATSYTFEELYSYSAQRRLKLSNKNYESFENLEQMARLANILSELSGALALANIDPLSSAISTADAIGSAVNWATTEINDPYRRQFAASTASSSTLLWADEAVPNPDGSFSQLPKDAIRTSQTMLEVGAAIGAVSNLAQSASTVRKIITKADTITTNVSLSGSSVSSLRTAGYTAVVGLAVGAAVESVSNVAESQARQSALGKGLTSAQRPLLNEILYLEQVLESSKLGPMGILRLQAMSQTAYQLGAAAWLGIGHMQQQLSDGLLGIGYDALLNTDRAAEQFIQTGRNLENLSHLTIAQTGRTFHLARDRYNNSLNKEIHGKQSIFPET
ncbi:outer membrane protein assembly factor BamB family protein [Haloarcula sp. CGMCC 1.2071]|uniref:outer membrane protein assembly factor BamB family protein n=1 Tax=Haloarcula sp. CGMCC 1.2071 TaxID=3111454 RepID=UPI00300EF148